MSEERETIEIITPIKKHKVVIKAWITGREKRILTRRILSGMKVDMDVGSAGGEVQAKEIDMGAVMEDAENKAIEIIVVSVNGKTEGILDAVLDMRDKDYQFVKKEINKISKDKDFLAQGSKPVEAIDKAN